MVAILYEAQKAKMDGEVGIELGDLVSLWFVR